MKRTLLIFWHTYWGHLTGLSYLFFTFGLPLLMVIGPLAVGAVAAVVVRSALPPTDTRPIGLVDQTPDRLFSDPAGFGTDPAPLRLFESRAAAVAALERGEIQSYYVIPAHYWQTGEIIGDYAVPPNMVVSGRFERWVSGRVRAGVPPEVLSRYDIGAHITHVNLAGEEAFTEDSYFEWGLLFAIIYVSRIVGMFTSGYMYNSIASEARNRTIEIVLTSISTVQFVTGKLLGLLAVGLTQLAVWATLPFLFVIFVAYSTDNNLLAFIFGWEPLPLIISLLLGAYVLDQIFAAATGILRVSGGAGPQLFNLVGWATTLALLYAAYFVPRNPHAPLAVIASLFPFTSPIVMLTRVVASEVPAWQVALSQVLLWGTCAAAVLLLTRLLRANMVAYAERFNLWRWLKARFESKAEV